MFPVRSFPAACAAFFLLGAVFSAEARAGAPSCSSGAAFGFVNETVLSGLDQPTALAFVPNDGRLLVAQKKGGILIADVSGVLPATPSTYMTLTDIHWQYSETGLVEIAFDPNFANNGLFYLFYANDSADRWRVASFEHDGATSTGDLTSESLIWNDDDDFSNCCHWGGGIDFGPDGKLYLSTGDKRPAFDPPNGNAQDLTIAAGKIHRMNPDGSIPPDNPFLDGAGPNVDTIWAYGLRNPFRLRFDDPTGRMFIGEVGEKVREDIHIGERGANFGWEDCEGICSDPTHVDPVFSYPTSPGASVTGGVVYRGNTYPAYLHGAYFYGDFKKEFIRYLTFDSTGTVVTGDFELDRTPGKVTAIEQGPDGALYYADFNGSVNRIRYSGSSSAHDCDDGNPCTTDRCGSGGNCNYDDVVDGVRCNLSGDACTGIGVCMSGACTSVAPPIPGDCNESGALDAGDPICSVLCLIGRPTPNSDCPCAADCNCSGQADAGDPVCAVLRLIGGFAPDPCGP